MRSFLLLIFNCVISSAQAQYLTAGLNTHVPIGAQKDKLKNAYGVSLGYERHITKSPFYLVADLSWSIFDLKTREQEVVSPSDGYVTKQKINYTSSIFNLTPGIGYAPLHNKNISPYVALKGGYMKYKTRMALYDPEDDDGCHPLDEENILRDFAAVGVVNGGFAIKVPAWGKTYNLDLGANYITGGKAKYLRMQDEDATSTPPDAVPYMTKFQQVQSGDVHEHSIGNVYTTKTAQLQLYVRVKIPFL
ncbi:MAG TPA: hypothetical protein VD794_00890 [Flavisolibacter sp.]|nr:hypothetical protein [Flavisolibacter sp.]